MRAGFLVIALVACFIALSAAAGADPVNEVNVQIKDIRPGGSYTLVFTANSYDTTGGQPPQVTSNTLRLASGVSIRPQFLGSRYRCDVPRMRDIIIENPERTAVRSQRFANLKATLGRIRKKQLTAEEAAIVERCVHAQIGSGTVVADTRPYIDDPVPAKLTLFLSKPMARGAIASIGVVAVIDESSKPYIENKKRVVRLLGPPVFYANVFNDPTPDGRYGYRIALPTPPTNLVLGVKISIAEVNVTVPGLTDLTKVVTCLRRVKGRCVNRKTTTRRAFWLTQPTCPASSQLGFESSDVYETGLRLTKAIPVPCPRFRP